MSLYSLPRSASAHNSGTQMEPTNLLTYLLTYLLYYLLAYLLYLVTYIWGGWGWGGP